MLSNQHHHHHQHRRTIMSSLLLVALLVGRWGPVSTVTVVDACSCLGPITFNNNLRDAQSAAARVLIRREIFPNGPLDDAGNGFRYFRAKIVRPYRGCQLRREQAILVKTGGNSALCGIEISQQTEYLLFGSQQEEDVKGLGKRQVLDVGLCGYQAKFRQLTPDQRRQLTRYQYVDNCRPALCDEADRCGPPPPIAPPRLCPDGSQTFYDINCVKVQSRCQWDIKSSSCPACSDDADCSFGAYCAAGQCTTKGTCAAAADCWNPSNVVDTTTTTTATTKPPKVPCLEGKRECLGSVCERSCCPSGDTVQCFADPCDTISKPYFTCVSNYCGGCNAYAFDKAGNWLNA